MDNNERFNQLPTEEQDIKAENVNVQDVGTDDSDITHELSKEEINEALKAEKAKKKEIKKHDKKHDEREKHIKSEKKHEKREKPAREPISTVKLRGIVAWVGIGVLCFAGVASLIASLLPNNGGLNYAILGMLCITSAVSLVIQLAILDSKAKDTEHKAAQEEKPAGGQDKLKEYEMAAKDLQIQALEKELEKEKTILGSLFELTDYLPKNEKFQQERKRQYEALVAVYKIKDILKDVEGTSNLTVRGQFLADVEGAIEEFNRKTGDDK